LVLCRLDILIIMSLLFDGLSACIQSSGADRSGTAPLLHRAEEELHV
jgi:hypothetical protein